MSLSVSVAFSKPANDDDKNVVFPSIHISTPQLSYSKEGENNFSPTRSLIKHQVQIKCQFTCEQVKTNRLTRLLESLASSLVLSWLFCEGKLAEEIPNNLSLTHGQDDDDND